MNRPEKIIKREIFFAVLTGIGKFIFMDLLDLKLTYISLVILGWTVYVLNRMKREKEVFSYWGFRIDNIKKVAKLILPFALISLCALIGIGLIKETMDFPWYILFLFIFYPIWGTIQHFLMIALVAGNISELNKKIPRWLIIFISATLFALIHFPDVNLIIGTFFLASFCTHIYLKERNIFALGIFHGILGVLFYYLGTDRDPFIEVFGNFI